MYGICLFILLLVGAWRKNADAAYKRQQLKNKSN